MSHQLTFDEIRRTRVADPETSKSAARQSRGLASEHNRKILDALRGGAELTAGEIAERCGLTSLQVSRRLAELRDAIEIRAVESEPGVPRTRPTPSGRPAQVWRRA